MLASRLARIGALLIPVLASVGFLAGSVPAQILIKPAHNLLYQIEPTANNHLCCFAEPVQGGIGDMDRDGHPDFLVINPHRRLNIYSGKTGALIYTYITPTTNNVNRFGQDGCVSAAGDVNKDGFMDIVVGEAYEVASGKGRVRVLSGAYIFRKIGKEVLHTFDGERSLDLHCCVGKAGDVNNDGYDDVVVGARGWDDTSKSQTSNGKMYVYSGKDGKLLYTRSGTQQAQFLGCSVDGVGDVNKDGFFDVAVASYGWDKGASANHGLVEVISGQFMTTKKGKEVLYSLEGERAGDSLGGFTNTIEGGVDVNNDRWPDLVVASPYYDGKQGADTGKVYLISGSFMHVQVKPEMLHTWEGDVAGARVGFDLNIAEDVNRDAHPDVISGSPFMSGNVGQVVVWSGLNGKELFRVQGETSRNYFGYRVDGVGDVNNDGYGDVIVGAWGWSSNRGRAYVISGKKLALVADEHVHTLSGTANNRQAFMLDAGTANAGRNYILASSFGMGPIQVGGLKIPLSADTWFNITLPMILTKNPFFGGWTGKLDGKGTGVANWTLPRSQSKALVGTTLWQAYIVFDNKGWYMASNAVPMTLIQ